MASPTRSVNHTCHALVLTGVVKAAASVTKGYPVKRDTATGTLENCTAGDVAHGIALESATAGNRFTYALANAGGVVPGKVGTGGATNGAYAVAVNDGLTDIAALGGGTTQLNIVGQFVIDEGSGTAFTGSAGDLVGVVPLSIPTFT